MFQLFTKDLRSYFTSATAGVAVGIFLCLMGAFLFVIPGEYNVFDSGYAQLDGLFALSPWLFLFLLPALTMRSFADEYRTGTFELLLSKPISPSGILMGKYLAAVAVALLALLPTLFYLLPVSLLGSPAFNMDYGAFWGSFIGLTLLVMVYAAIGVFTSSLGENQVAAFLIGALLCFLAYYGLELAASLAGGAAAADFLSRLSLSHHYEALSRGAIDSSGVLFFLSEAAVFLLLTYLRLYRRGLRNFAIALAVLICLNLLGSKFFVRADLTAEKRYTLSPLTKELLRGCEEPISVELYLDGDLNLGFLRLQKEAEDLLRDMGAYAGGGVSVVKIDPSEARSNEERKARYARLAERGMQPTAVYERDKGGNMQQKIIFPWAAVSMGGDTALVSLLANVEGLSGAENLNISAEGLEYAFTDAIRRLAAEDPGRVAFIEGHGEWGEEQVYDITEALSNYYYVDRGTISGSVDELLPYKALIIAGPTRPFSEREKYALDQYFMNGGSLLFLVDGAMAGEDAAYAPDLNLADLLFTYGVRIDPLLLLDTECASVPMNMAPSGEAPRFEPQPWYYAPLLQPSPGHVIGRNLSRVRADFCSPLAFVGEDSLRRSVLLATAGNTGAERLPAVIRPDVFALSPQSGFFAWRSAPVAALVEGSFRSAFRNRIAPEGVSNSLPFKQMSGDNAKLIVISDGDLIANASAEAPSGAVTPLPLGYDRYAGRSYANRDFLLNAVNYLADDHGWLNLRGREFKLRLLDKAKVAQDRNLWGVLGILGPLGIVALVILFARVVRRG